MFPWFLYRFRECTFTNEQPEHHVRDNSFVTFFSTENFKDFKLELHRLFPVVYDTKFIAFEIRGNPVSTRKLVSREDGENSFWFVPLGCVLN